MPNRDLNRSNDSGTGAKGLDRGSIAEGQPGHSPTSPKEAMKGGEERHVDDQALGGDREQTVGVKAVENADETSNARVNGSNVSN